MGKKAKLAWTSIMSNMDWRELMLSAKVRIQVEKRAKGELIKAEDLNTLHSMRGQVDELTIMSHMVAEKMPIKFRINKSGMKEYQEKLKILASLIETEIIKARGEALLQFYNPEIKHDD